MLDLLDVDVLPHEGRGPGDGVHAGGGDEHELLGLTVTPVNGVAGFGPDRV